MDAAERTMAEREVAQAFESYEAALAANDLDALAAHFRPGDDTVRMTTDGGLYGHAAIQAYRRGRDTRDLARELTRVQITALTPDVAIAVAEYRRRASDRRGAQSQVWLREDGRWRIAAAHVSLGPDPADG